MSDDGFEGLPPMPEGRSAAGSKFTVIQGGKALESSLDDVRKRMKEYYDGHNKQLRSPDKIAAVIRDAVFAGMPKPEIDTFIEWCFMANVTSKGNLNQYFKNAEVELKNAKKAERIISGDWKVHLQQSLDGRSYISNSYNIELMLANDLAFAGYFRFDKFRYMVVVVDRPPWLHKNLLHSSGTEKSVPEGGFGWPMDDTILTALRIELQGRGLHNVNRKDVDECIEKVSKLFSYNSLTDFLDNLQWDGTPRLNRWLVDYCGSENTLYTRMAARWWAISAVARAYQPGCKADYMLLLESPQGYKKTTFWMTIARRKEWYGELTEDLKTSDGKKQLRTKWIVALQELSALTKRQVHDVKAFLTQQMDSWRELYERYFKDHPRSFVFCGDTNDEQYLIDATGNRRYWPVKCQRIDISGLEPVMDQIWAEAVFYYKNGHVWWPDIDSRDPEVALVSKEFERLQIEQADIRYRTDPWESPVIEWLAKGNSEGRDTEKLPGSTRLCQLILGMSAKDVGMAEATRMGTVIRRLGYLKQTVWLDGHPVEGFRKRRGGE